MEPSRFDPDEMDRLSELWSLNILDTGRDERFDRLTRLACSALGVPIATVSLVDATRQWFKSRQGLDVSETSREVSFCSHAILKDETFVVPDAASDARFADNPLVTGPPHIRFYAGHPLVGPEGGRLGTLCVMSREPRELSAEQQQILRDLASLVEDQLQSVRLAVTHRLLAQRQESSTDFFDNAADPFQSVAEDGTLLFVNKAWRALLDYVDVDPPTNIFEVLVEEHREPCRSVLKAALESDDVVRVKTTFLARGGRRVLVSGSVTAGTLTADGHRRTLGVFRDVTEEQAQLARLRADATTDALTGLANRRVLEERLALLEAEARRYGRSYCAALLDVDHFKRVNDVHGHAVGDKVLQRLAATLRARLRDTDLAARYGGEEFCVVLVDVTLEHATRIVDELRLAFKESTPDDGSEPAASFSAGVALREGPLEPGDLLKAADGLLYEAKRAGRDRVLSTARVKTGA